MKTDIVYNKDCYEGLKKIPDKSIDLVYIDPPYNFKRTGCKGCPFNVKIQNDLETMYKLLPNEYKQCLHIWKPVYDEYIRIGYRLKEYPHEKGIQLSMFDILENGDDTNDN